MESKKIMILGASILQLPAILKAKELGLQVITVDYDDKAIGHQHSDICEIVSTLDIPKVVDIAKKHKINGVMTLASDMPLRTVATVAKELGLASITEETAMNATNKGVMRDILKVNGVPEPLYYKVSSKEAYSNVVKKFDRKCIVKPVDNSGSRGVYLIEDVENSSQVDAAFTYSQKYSRSGDIIVEEYMSGEEVSVETISVDGKVHVIAITDKLTTGAPNFVEMGHSQPSRHSKEVKKRVSEVTSMAVKALGIKDGPSHTEIMITKDGPKVIEIGARLGGDNITTHLTPLSTGVNMVECCIRIALGEKPEIIPKINKGSAIRYLRTQPGVLVSIEGINDLNNVEGVKQVSFVKEIGDKVGAIRNSLDRLGFVIAESNDAANAIRICEEAIERLDIIVEEK